MGAEASVHGPLFSLTYYETMYRVINMHPSLFVTPQNLIFRFLQSRQKIQIWLFDHNDMRIEGRIIVSLI
jgi:hypothetical protein